MEITPPQTTKQVYDKPRNPTGKGGFQERPQDISSGSWKKENTISYQYRRFMNMDPDELKAFAKLPSKEKTVAMEIAFRRVVASYKSLADTKEIADRTEGKAKEFVDLTSDGDKITFGNMVPRNAGE